MIKVFALGRITKDIDLTVTPNGITVARFSIAIKKNKDETNFYNVVAFKTIAENINKYFAKGSLIAISGTLDNNTVEKDGRKTTYTNIIANEFDFCGDKKQEQGQAQDNGYVADRPSDDGFMTVQDSDLPF